MITVIKAHAQPSRAKTDYFDCHAIIQRTSFESISSSLAIEEPTRPTRPNVIVRYSRHAKRYFFEGFRRTIDIGDNHPNIRELELETPLDSPVAFPTPVIRTASIETPYSLYEGCQRPKGENPNLPSASPIATDDAIPCGDGSLTYQTGWAWNFCVGAVYQKQCPGTFHCHTANFVKGNFGEAE